MDLTPSQQKAIDQMKAGAKMVLTADGTWYNNELRCEIWEPKALAKIGKLRYDLFESLEAAGVVKYRESISGVMYYELT